MQPHAYSSPGSAGEEELSGRQHLTFVVGGELYAFQINRVKEILRFETVTRVPSAPASVRGVINLRGAVVPVVDIAVKFGLGESRTTRRSCVVIIDTEIEGEATVMGVLTDAVNEVVEIPDGAIEPPPSFGLGSRHAFLTGMVQRGSKFIQILDMDALISAGDVPDALPDNLIEEISASDSHDGGDSAAQCEIPFEG